MPPANKAVQITFGLSLWLDEKWGSGHGLHVNQIKRYEAGSAQPTLDALVSLAHALHTILDDLVFEEGERGPSEQMRLQFEAISQLPDEDQRAVRAMLDGMIVKHQAKKMVGSLSS